MSSRPRKDKNHNIEKNDDDSMFDVVVDHHVDYTLN
jgi:hypothetical protein